MYRSEIISDSLSPQGDRLTTFIVQFPRIVLSEFSKHRMFSFSSASSRAIPFKKMVKMVEENPFIPIAWQKNHKGMQGSEYLTNDELKYNWLEAKDEAIRMAKTLNEKGVTKQLCNRLLEPFMWHKVIITSGKEGLENFFNLRCPQYYDKIEDTYKKSKKDISSLNDYGEYPKYYEDTLGWLKINHSQADIHIQAIGEMMWDCYNKSKPRQLEAGEYHIPFGDNINWSKFSNLENIKGLMPNEVAIKIATARCARVSYNNFLGKDDYEADINLYDRLKKDKHSVPFEHCAKAMSDEEYQSHFFGKLRISHIANSDMEIDNYFHELDVESDKKYYGWSRNFKGFISHRAELNI